MKLLMRFLGALLYNAWLVARGLLALPMRWMRRRHRPQFIRYRLKGDPPYLTQRSRSWLRRRASPAEVSSLEQLRAEFKQLIADPRVRGVLLILEGLRISAGKREALATLFRQMRSAGKLVVGYATHADNREYELLCFADRIVLFPAGRLELTGFTAEATALGGALQHAGIAAHFVRRGQYKTAPELFTQRTVSEVQRETLERILDERFGALVADIAQGRNLEVEQARAKVDHGPYTAKRALNEGLCDALCSEDELDAYLAGLLPDAAGDSKRHARIGSFREYIRTRPFAGLTWKRFQGTPRVGWIPLHGMIVPGEVSGSPIGVGVVGSKTVCKALKAAAADSRCHAIVLQVESPGGSALASELILDEVRRTAAKKPLLAYTDQVVASGGYLSALGAKEIWAAPHAIVGSIGVFAGKFDFSGLLGRLGVQRTIFTRGQNAGIFSASRPFTEAEKHALEAEVEETYQDFLQAVARARGTSVQQVHEVGEGRIFSGAQALQVGLIDQVGSFERACERALELASLPTERYRVRSYAPRARRFSLLAALREISTTHLYALWDGWLGKVLLFSLLAALSIPGGCATDTARTVAEGPPSSAETGSAAVLQRFLDAADRGDFETAYELLSQIWRVRYTPERLKRDFALEPRAKDLLGRARTALKGSAKEEGDVVEYPIGDGNAVRLVREGGAFRIAALE